MSWPRASDYNEAVQNPKTAFSDPELKSGAIVTDKMGLPLAMSGAFAIVYQVDCAGVRHAVRCLLKDIPDIENRYAAISAYLQRTKLPYMVEFEFMRQGILVAGKWYPILKMEWANGESLDRYIQRNITNRPALVELSGRFLQMAADLHKANIAHGDLQNGNILVCNGDLRLVDYDGMYVPSLAGQTSNELGQRNFQHPRRSSKDFGPYLDNFSEWVISLSLWALGLGVPLPPGVEIDNDNLLFQEQDLNDPGRSTAFRAIEGSGNPRLQALTSLLISFTHLTDLAQIPTLEAHVAQDSFSRVVSAPIPAWVADRLAAATPAAASPQPAPVPLGASWILDHLASSTANADLTGPFPERRWLFSTAAIVAVIALASLLTSLPAIPITLTVALMAALALVALYERYLGIPVVGQARQVDQRVSEAHAALEKVQEEISRLDRAKEQADRNKKEKTERLLKDQRELEPSRATAIDSWNRKVESTLSHITLRKQELAQAQANELQSKLLALQNQFMARELRKYPIERANIRGVGPTMKGRLADQGVRTAADLLNVNIVRGRYRADPRHYALLEITGGRLISVPGVGPGMARSLLAWRRTIEASAQSNMPRALTPDQQQVIVAKYYPRLQALDDEAVKFAKRSQQEMATIQSRFQGRQEALAQELMRVPDSFGREIADLDARLSLKNRELAVKQWELAKVERELAPYRKVSFGSYLRRLLYLG